MNDPLVSIIVITYNSAKYVLETLESAKVQTYKNVELIVTDDGSKDDTVEICNAWIQKNKERFVKTEIITVEKNTGIPENCNRGIRKANGKWIKLIAGDDLLLDNCISDNISYAMQHSGTKIVQSNCHIYNGNFDKMNYSDISKVKKNLFKPDVSANKQYKILLRKNLLFAPAFFYHTQTIKAIGGFDERIRLIEDWPMWLRVTKCGVKINYFDRVTCCYRANYPVKIRLMSNEYVRELHMFYSLYKKGQENRIRNIKFATILKVVFSLNNTGVNKYRLSRVVYKTLARLLWV